MVVEEPNTEHGLWTETAAFRSPCPWPQLPHSSNSELHFHGLWVMIDRMMISGGDVGFILFALVVHICVWHFRGWLLANSGLCAISRRHSQAGSRQEEWKYSSSIYGVRRDGGNRNVESQLRASPKRARQQHDDTLNGRIRSICHLGDTQTGHSTAGSGGRVELGFGERESSTGDIMIIILHTSSTRQK
jgi:hypothetical protein